jgi:hypothetical protein
VWLVLLLLAALMLTANIVMLVRRMADLKSEEVVHTLKGCQDYCAAHKADSTTEEKAICTSLCVETLERQKEVPQ